ncbi:uncharacterized protein LOC100824223 isoform X6 [Brachypodium distachyon]|uniref:Uncharacterized protein n=1 Tax=Brachypodium distachyon TaxID=15368 RepID=I1IRU3_BRADI|nr:uncharacterized protein LOC100824223 isoform X6 [Brachypodium distachyon]KQJ91023.1 hypothetical protein BRADI_4g35162v3 [Brachypodium distachyon]|eukprot:XP_003576730.1 uncharacterized protein LOC100824223 isoform X6 [Brachypodium distachyon]
MEVAAEPGAYEEMLRVVEACAARIRWRLRPQSKRRLLNDILFLCAGLRSVILMDYGGTMPLLQENLCSLLHHAQQEASILNPLRVMVIKDMLYLIHVKGLAEHVSPNARSRHQPAFVDLEKSCCELLVNTEENGTVLELLSIQDGFSGKFPLEAAFEPGTTKQESKLAEKATAVEYTDIHVANRTSLVLDLSAILENTQIALPSLNGWLLGYPVTYLFRNESAEAATQNLSKHSLHIYRIYVVRSPHSDAKPSEEELLSFSVPCEMSVRRDEEPWAKSFLACMNEKLERCNHVWASMRLEIDVFRSQSGVIVL